MAALMAVLIAFSFISSLMIVFLNGFSKQVESVATAAAAAAAVAVTEVAVFSLIYMLLLLFDLI